MKKVSSSFVSKKRKEKDEEGNQETSLTTRVDWPSSNAKWIPKNSTQPNQLIIS